MKSKANLQVKSSIKKAGGKAMDKSGLLNRAFVLFFLFSALVVVGNVLFLYIGFFDSANNFRWMLVDGLLCGVLVLNMYKTAKSYLEKLDVYRRKRHDALVADNEEVLEKLVAPTLSMFELLLVCFILNIKEVNISHPSCLES